MFSKETYIRRREELKKLVGNGLIVLFGNNESPCNYPANSYYPMRQDSSFLYYFGQKRDGLVGVIDIDNNDEILIGDNIDIEDIVWYGSVDSVADLAAQVGVAKSAPMSHLKELCDQAAGRTIHFLPPYRHDIKIQIMDLLGIHPSKQKAAASMPLIRAVVKMRSKKDPQEIEALERAAAIGYKMHATAMRLTRPGVTEKYVGGQIDGIANSYGAMVSFATIYSQHGEIMHGNPSTALLESGRLVICDCGAETIDHYCSDNTRTMPVSGKFSQRQLDIYSIVEECHDYVLDVAKPGVKYMDVHFAVCRRMTERLKELGLMRGDTEEAVRAGAQPDPTSSSLAPTACAWGAVWRRASSSPMSQASTLSPPSSMTGALPATAPNSSTSTCSTPTRTSVACASRTTCSSLPTVAASSARSASPTIPRTLRRQ